MRILEVVLAAQVGLVMIGLGSWMTYHRETCRIVQYQEPTITVNIILPIQYAKLLPARKAEAIAVPTSPHVNQHLPASIFYQL